jgi:opacity protein-like surface antigen
MIKPAIPYSLDGIMRIRSFRGLVCGALAAAFWAAGPAHAADLYLAGDLGISWYGGDGKGTNDLVGITNKGSSDDQTPVWGAALGAVFPLSSALPFKMRLPGFAIPYWPGHEMRYEGSDEATLPDWEMRTDVEYLNGRDAELATPSFNPLDTYRVDAHTWTLMGKVRLDVPLRTPVRALLGRMPALEPVSLYLGGGAGVGFSELKVNTGVLAGKDSEKQQFAWQGIAGIGYDLTERVKLSLGYRYLALGQEKARLIDAAGVDRGNYKMDLSAHEFSASLAVRFWQLPPLLGDDE